jgi:uncharacterized protein (DUF1697 family)
MVHVALLRGINVGGRNRVPMAELREELERRFGGPVRTYVQSGNVVLDGEGGVDAVAQGVREAISERFGLEIRVIVRSADELAAVIARDPLGSVAQEPKLYQVSFLDSEPGPEVVERLAGLAAAGERLVAGGRELYSWHPDGVARSKLAVALSSPKLGATARNWRTVTALMDMCLAG